MTHQPSSFDHQFLAEEFAARDALCAVMKRLREMGLAEDQMGGVEIALAEVVNNIVEHAYADLDPGDIFLNAQFEDDQLKVHIKDRGHPLPDGELPEGRPADVSGAVDDLPEGGFGWFMIRTLARDIRYRREDGCNRLFLSFDLIPPAR